MRALGLLAFAIFLPVFAHGAAALVNINTADAALLDTLPGIGLAKADAIIRYRQEHGAFGRIEDIQNVSGIGSGSTYAKIAPLITAGAPTVTTDAPGTASAAEPAAQSSQVPSARASTYVPPPSVLTVDAGADREAFLEVPLRLSARVVTKSGAADSSARIAWSFGDGSAGEGSATEKTYRYAGTYLVKVTATDGTTSAEAEFTVVAKPALVRIASVSGDGITIANDSSERLDLSLWRLSAGTGFFRIPNGTVLLPEANVLFPSSVTNLPVALEAALAYPDGVIAARYPSPVPAVSLADMQLSASTTGSSSEQTAEQLTGHGEASPAQSQRSISNTAHENQAVSAPAAAIGLAAAGAAVPSPDAPNASSSPFAKLFKSHWTLGLLGVMTLAAGAFILL